jgi:hypothetical protein
VTSAVPTTARVITTPSSPRTNHLWRIRKSHPIRE